jgi:putative aldouronate transport system substrate-binding protein
MKKSLSVLLCLLLTVGLSFANGSKDAASANFAKDPDFVNGKFKTTRNITVEVYDRSNDGGSKPDNNFFTNYIKAGMLKEHNVAVTFKTVPRWTEVDAMNNLLAAGTAPDVCVTYSMPTVNTYAQMGGVLDMNKYLSGYKDNLTNLWTLLGDRNIYWEKDPTTGTVFAIDALMFQNNRTATFVREDWLKKLKIAEPKTITEFEAMLKAFKDNASTLLGKDAGKMIPFSTGIDIGWECGLIMDSFIPNAITDKDWWIRGFCDRHSLQPGFKDGMRVLNKWYNQGLIWKDFPLYAIGDKTAANNEKAGYVGAFIGNFDAPYRDGENGVNANLKKLVGPDAGYIAIDCFKNNAGLYRKYLSAPVDRKVFFPSTNKEPLASLMYLDFISSVEVRKFLQIGEEGVNHVTQDDKSVKMGAVKGEKIQNSDKNIDYTILINGLDLGDPVLTTKSLANSYPGVDKRYIERAVATQRKDARIGANFNVGIIAAEEGQGPAFTEKRNNMLVQSVVAKPADFDAVWDNGMKDILASGVQAIIDERTAKWSQFYGTAAKK